MRMLVLLITMLISIGGQTDVDRTEVESERSADKNVVFIIADDLNKTLGCYGHPLVQTPNIDKLAARGVQFEHAYANFAVCNPSRSSFLSGLRPETTTILDNYVTFQSVSDNWLTMPALFKLNGFYTVSLGKIFHSPKAEHNDLEAWDELHTFGSTPIGQQGEGRNLTNGALKWCAWRAAEGDDEDQQDGQIARKAVEFIKGAHDKPFFLAVGLHKPHDPFVAPKKYFDMYPIEDCNPPQLPDSWEPPYGHTLPGETSEFNKFSEQEKREFLRSYYACTSFMDVQVGKVMDALEESGQLENTLVIFMGDHGYHLGEHNWWNKVTLFEKGMSAPFIMAGGNVGEKGAKSDAMFEYVDIYPTLADLLRLKNAPKYLEGKSFAKVVRDPSQPFRDEVRAVILRGEMMGKCVKTESWRYVEWGDGEMGAELYNQLDDPIEYHNLAGEPQYADVIATMKQLLHKAD